MDGIAGSEQFLVLLTSHQRRLEGYLRILVPNRADAEEVLQETNLYICRHASDFRPGTDFSAWALRVAHFCVLAWRTRQSRSRLVFNDSLLEQIAVEACPIDMQSENRRQALTTCLNKLDPPERELITQLYSDSNVTPQSVAEQVGRSVNAIYISIHRIRVRLFACVRRTLAAAEHHG